MEKIDLKSSTTFTYNKIRTIFVNAFSAFFMLLNDECRLKHLKLLWYKTVKQVKCHTSRKRMYKGLVN